ncbi:MAG TPA: HupE/UreJ family protein [Rhizomicrobium sp.]|nr:HupE/UreJ family protein [Rhizomicrobium sp.]
MKGIGIQPALAAAALFALIEPALAHTGTDTVFGFQTGFLHPISGPDHLVAMVAVGLWGAQLGAPAIWILPITFPLVMAIGGVLGVVGIPVPFVETVIALSAVALGLVVALRLRPPLWAAAVLVAVFAIFHGYAHGRELPGAADPVGYGVGFVVATGLLHLAGILIGTLTRRPLGAQAVRACGAAIACAGLFFLVT